MKTVKYQPANKFWKGNWKWAKFMYLLRDGKWRRWSRRRGRSRGWRRGYTGRGCSTKPRRAVSYHDPSSRPALPILERLQRTKFLNCYLFFPFPSLVRFGSSYSGRKGKETAFCRVLETSDGSLGERERSGGRNKKKKRKGEKIGAGGAVSVTALKMGERGTATFWSLVLLFRPFVSVYMRSLKCQYIYNLVLLALFRKTPIHQSLLDTASQFKESQVILHTYRKIYIYIWRQVLSSVDLEKE